MSYSQAKEIVAIQALKRPPGNLPTPNHSALLYSHVAGGNISTTSGSQPQTCLMQHMSPSSEKGSKENPPKENSYRTLPETLPDQASNIVIKPLDLIAFVAEVVQLSIASFQTAETPEILNIVSTASMKYFGYAIESLPLPDDIPTPSIGERNG